MVHFIIINWFYWIGVWIWNRFRVRLNWKLWRVNLNITIINGMMIKYHVVGPWSGSLGSLFVAAYWRVRVVGLSGPIYRVSDRMYVSTILTPGCMNRRSRYRGVLKGDHFCIFYLIKWVKYNLYIEGLLIGELAPPSET